jgi:hypothetical protein
MITLPWRAQTAGIAGYARGGAKGAYLARITTIQEG